MLGFAILQIIIILLGCYAFQGELQVVAHKSVVLNDVKIRIKVQYFNSTMAIWISTGVKNITINVTTTIMLCYNLMKERIWMNLL